MKKIINNHNMKIIENEPVENKQKCNCRNKERCPLMGLCLEREIVYQATITSNQPAYKEKVYLGISEDSFKTRYGNHKQSFKYTTNRYKTELSKEYWKIKDKKFVPNVTWKIIRKCLPFNPNIKKCHLCLSEKLEIALYEGDNLLNKKTELISKCRHKNKFTLLRHDSKD